MHSNVYFLILTRVKLFRHRYSVVLDHKFKLLFKNTITLELRDPHYHLSRYTSEVLLPRQASCLLMKENPYLLQILKRQ